MIYMFLSNNPWSGDINSSNLSCFTIIYGHGGHFGQVTKNIFSILSTEYSI